MKRKIFLAINCMVLLASCSDSHLQTTRWNGLGEKPDAPKNLKPDAAVLSFGQTHLQMQQQNIDGALVEGTTFKKISNSKGDQFISFSWMDSVPFRLRAEIAMMKAEKYLVVEQFLLKYPAFRIYRVYEQPQMIVRNNPDPEVVWRLSFEQKNGILLAVDLNRKYKIIKQQTLGSEFFDATAYLYPNGPLKSELSTVILQKLSNEGILKSEDVNVTTQATLIAKAENNQFLYPTHDIRFSQVQVYFYLIKMKDWFFKNFQFNLPFVLSAETFVGFPEKTNTAFYYQQKIRLGEGDGVVFSDLALDPTVVIHESVHAVVQAVASLPYSGEGGSLNEAYADFFTTTIQNNPNLGEASYKKASFKRTVDNDLKRQDVNQGLYHDAGIVSGLMWSLSKSLGQQKAITLAWQILIRLDQNSSFDSFKVELLDCLNDLNSADQEKAKSILKQRGWIE